ncbi:DUF6286 domain-containing protein [Geodermatophilus nigrescens]|uniref:DUF6286 domain-containing protein n=1 Tax=Geodermatophilus nigrescens TaxID=1070870 RepID=A0A1M5RRV7_9ACTN|nr:DUF6286 domain-containing protein [Geodermatophilus nigrescens]SHH29025.1 hypothetical protein SAMN05444351_4468 [Geodermatophilus nigrescens]
MRTLDRVLAVLLAAGGLVLGVLVVVEVVAAGLGRPPVALPYSPVAAWLRETPWSSAAALAVAAGLAVLGLALLVAELAPRRRTDLVLTGDDPATTATLSVRSLARVLESAATGVPGVERASARVRRRRARLSVHVPVRDGEEATRIGREAQSAASAALDALSLRAAPRLRVRTRQEVR